VLKWLKSCISGLVCVSEASKTTGKLAVALPSGLYPFRTPLHANNFVQSKEALLKVVTIPCHGFVLISLGPYLRIHSHNTVFSIYFSLSVAPTGGVKLWKISPNQ
jgi:hypothetical protein